MSNIKNKIISSDLLEQARVRGQTHNNYHHYTTMDNLCKILESGYFHLSNSCSLDLNDQQELRQGNNLRRKKTYIGSFSYGNSEIMAMWGLYGIPWEQGIRFSIPKRYMIEWINSINNNKNKIIFEFDNNLYSCCNDLEKIYLSDIIYKASNKKSDSHKYYLGSHSFIMDLYKDKQFNKSEEVTGLIKNMAWQYENEVRVIALLKEGKSGKKMAIKIPDYILENLNIMYGPGFKCTNNMNKKIKNSSCSEFHGQVKYRNICDFCKNTFDNKS